jgi:peptide/nickel transport system permease protein
MLRFVVLRVALGIATLFAVSILIFVAIALLPGDFATEILGQSATPEAVEVVRHSLGLHEPLLPRYWHWLHGFVLGDFGISLATGRPVIEQILPRMSNTILLAGIVAVISVPLAILLGISAAVFADSAYDKFLTSSSLAVISFPEFFVAYVLIAVFSQKLGWLPSLAVLSPGMSLTDEIRILGLPSIALVIIVVGHMMRMSRAAVLDILARSFIETAILKGLPAWRVIVQHALPNALAPIVNVISFNLAYLLTGVVVIEAIFVYPGLGSAMIDAVGKRDVTVVQACGVLFAGTYVMLNMLSDVLTVFLNPRLRHPK